MLPRSIAILASLVVSTLATCYFPDGGISPADVACNAAAADSACCFSHQACLSNGLCMTGEVNGIQQYARGTCTDPNWESGACPNFCLDQQGLGNVMYSCNVTGSDSYCCNNDCGCSQNGINQVVSFTGEPYTITVIGIAGTYPNPSATLSSTSTSMSSSAEITPTSSTSFMAASTTVIPNGAAQTSSTVSPSSTSSSSGSSATAIGIGVGVGVGGAILLLGIGAFFIHRRRQRANQGQTLYSDKHISTPPAYAAEDGYAMENTNPQNESISAAKSQASEPSELGISDPHMRSELPSGNERRAELP